jgi:hypothetical protein
MLVEPATAVTAPVQVFTRPFGVATKTFPGKASTNGDPLVIVWAAAFVLPSVIVSVDVPPEAIDAGLKAFATVGGALIVRVAWATPGFVSPSFVTTLPIGMLSRYAPGVFPRTFAENAQLVGSASVPAGIVAPAKDSVPPPAVAVARPPVQVVKAFGVDAISRPAGSVSVRDTPVSGIVLPFVIVTVRTELTPGLLVTGANTLLTVGLVTTKRVAAAAVEFGTPWSVVTEFTGIVLL